MHGRPCQHDANQEFINERTCQKLAGDGGGGGVETEKGSQLFEIAGKGGVMKNEPLKGGGSCKYVSVIM